jgi:hypothetical protein
MLQRGDRTGAAKQVDTPPRNFPNQQDLVADPHHPGHIQTIRDIGYRFRGASL